MGAWGTAIFSDDLAADVRGDFRDCIGDGLSVEEATARLQAEYLNGLDDDDDDLLVFWIALALSQWNIGRVHEPTRKRAIEIIKSGRELSRWDSPTDRDKRQSVLERAAQQLLSPAPNPKRVPKRHRSANTWATGEIIGLQLKSGRWTLVRVIGHHQDKGGRFAVTELLDWVGAEIPTRQETVSLSIRRGKPPEQHITQFMFCEPRTKKDQARVRRLDFALPPRQSVGGFAVMPWKYFDHLMEKLFGLT
jgi:hypothetical protein